MLFQYSSQLRKMYTSNILDKNPFEKHIHDLEI